MGITSASLQTQFTAANDLEQDLSMLIKEYGLSEQKMKNREADALKKNEFTEAEVKERMAKLRRMQMLLFEQERKNKRIKAIKSKAFKKTQRAKREKYKLSLEEMEAIDPEMAAEERIRLEKQRALERATNAHKNTSSWAKQQLRRVKYNTDARAALQENIRRGQELKKRIRSIGGEDGEDGADYDDDDEGDEGEGAFDRDSDDSDAEEERSRKELEQLKDEYGLADGSSSSGKTGKIALKVGKGTVEVDDEVEAAMLAKSGKPGKDAGGASGVFSMAFMQRASNAQKEANRAMLAAMDDEDAEDAASTSDEGEKQQQQQQASAKKAGTSSSLQNGSGPEGVVKGKKTFAPPKASSSNSLVDAGAADEAVRESSSSSSSSATSLKGSKSSPASFSQRGSFKGGLFDIGDGFGNQSDQSDNEDAGASKQGGAGHKRGALTAATTTSSAVGSQQRMVSALQELRKKQGDVGIAEALHGARPTPLPQQQQQQQQMSGATPGQKRAREENAAAFVDSDSEQEDPTDGAGKRLAELDSLRAAKKGGAIVDDMDVDVLVSSSSDDDDDDSGARDKGKGGASNPWARATGSSAKSANEATRRAKGEAAHKGSFKYSKEQAETAAEAKVRSKGSVLGGALAKSEVVLDMAPSLLAQSSARSKASRDEDDERWDGNDQTNGMDLTANAQAEQAKLVARAFSSGNEAEESFAKLKAREVEDVLPQEDKFVAGVPGWGSWAGSGERKSKKQRKMDEEKTKNHKEEIARQRAAIINARKDKDLSHVIISEKTDKKALKYQMPSIPHPFTSREQYERSLRVPLGKEWNTQTSLINLHKPAVITREGTIIKPIKWSRQFANIGGDTALHGPKDAAIRAEQGPLEEVGANRKSK